MRINSLSMLSNVGNNDVVKKAVHNLLVLRVNDIDAKTPSISTFLTETVLL